MHTDTHLEEAMPNYLVRNTSTGALFPVCRVNEPTDAYLSVIESEGLPQSVADAPLAIMDTAWVFFSRDGEIRDAKAALWDAIGPDASEAERDAIWVGVVWDGEACAFYCPDLMQAIEATAEDK